MHNRTYNWIKLFETDIDFDIFPRIDSVDEAKDQIKKWTVGLDDVKYYTITDEVVERIAYDLYEYQQRLQWVDCAEAFRILEEDPTAKLHSSNNQIFEVHNGKICYAEINDRWSPEWNEADQVSFGQMRTISFYRVKDE